MAAGVGIGFPPASLPPVSRGAFFGLYGFHMVVFTTCYTLCASECGVLAMGWLVLLRCVSTNFFRAVCATDEAEAIRSSRTWWPGCSMVDTDVLGMKVCSTSSTVFVCAAYSKERFSPCQLS